MRHRRLGRTALQVSELCLGTMNFGPNTTEADSFELLDHALDNDIDFVDTADRYGGSLGVGATETIIGNWLAQGGDRRERIVLATKLFGPMSDRPNDRGLSGRHIRLACDASLRRLQTDHIDLYQMHHIDRSAPWDEVWQAMETLVAQGKISYVGSSNFAGWPIAQANEAAARRDFLGLVSEQSLYNLTERTIELEVIPACEAYGVGSSRGVPLPVACSRACSPPTRWDAVRRNGCTSGSRRSGRNSMRGRSCAANSASRPRPSASPGCCTSPRSPHRSSGHARWSSSTTPSAHR